MKKSENKDIKPPNSKKKWPFKVLKIIGKIVLGLLLLLFLVLLFIRSPWGQDIIVTKAVSYLSNKTQTKVAVEKLFITFDGDILLKELYLEDPKGDTLIYSKKLEANVPLWALIQGSGIGVDGLEWEGVRANITRKDSITGFNFQFIIDAFASEDSTQVETDTTTAPLNLILGNLQFQDFDVVYNDAVTGIDSRYKIGKLHANMDKTDLENLNFQASNLELSDSRITFYQTPVPETADSESAKSPLFTVDNLELTNVYADYKSDAGKLAAKVFVNEFFAKIPKIDLSNQLYEVDEFRLKGSDIAIKTESQNTNSNTAKSETEFQWPAIGLDIKQVALEDNRFSYTVNNQKAKKGYFNPNAINLSALTFQAENIILKDEVATLLVNQASLNEESGVHLKNLKFKLDLTDKRLNLSSLLVAVNNNHIEGNLQVNYTSLVQFFNTPDQSKVALNLPSFKLSLADLFLFQPDLKENDYLNILSQNRITGLLKADGFVSDISISKMEVDWNETQFKTNGRIQNITKPDTLSFNIPMFSAVTTRSDLVLFVQEDSLGVQLPETLSLTGVAKGNLQDMVANASLNTSQGDATINGDYKNDTRLAFNADVSVDDYKLNELLNNEQLGNLNLKISASGEGNNINDLNASMDAVVSNFTYNNYDVKDLKLTGNIKDGEGQITSDYKDENLNADLYADVVLDSISPEINADINIIGADLQGLGLVNRNLKTALNLKAYFKGNSTSFDANTQVTDGIFVYDEKSYLLGGLEASAHVRKDTTAVSVQNKMLNLSLQSNADPEVWTNSLKHHVLSYFNRDGYKDSVRGAATSPVNLKLRGKISQSPILNEVFLVNVKDLDTIDIAVDYNEAERKLDAKVLAPHINYSDLELDSLAFTMQTDLDKFNFQLGFNEVTAGPLNIQKTSISGNQENKELALRFLAFHENETLTQVLGKITGTRDELRFHVDSDSLILNKSFWDIPDNNEMLIYDKKIAFNEFLISKGNQAIEITDKLPNISKDHVAVDFKNFKLNEFLSYLNPDVKLASGNLNGNFILEEPFANTGIVANLDISKFQIMEVDLGGLAVNAKSLGGNSYDFNASLKEGEIDLDLKGGYLAKKTGAELDLSLVINRFNMTALTGFSQGEITETSGAFSGKFKLRGTTASPQYRGKLNFTDANFKIAMFNSAFTLADETLTINEKSISMNAFTIADENKNTFQLSGEVGTETFVNPSFNLQVKAKDFQVLNASKDDNDFLYGKASFDGSAKISGDLLVPKIDMDMTVTSDTDITYVLPSATVNVEERDGVVVFVNRENPDAILTRSNEKTATIKGFDISALVKIGKEATVTLIIDEETGDNFKVSGEGDFNATMNPNGNVRLSGVYEVLSGHYELNLYKIVNRKFSLVPGSRVTWSGDPFDAKLDVKALYEVEASASSLMAPVYSGSDPAIKDKFRQVLPFLVYLNIDGQLMEPEISFDIDMPEEEQGAISGQVYGRVQQLNNQEDELNRQVFSLLVLNRFYPDPGSDGSSGGVASIARDNLNDAVADQLNMFTDKILGTTGFELDFGINSYTDYQGTSPQQRTQLDIAAQKKLFDDRLIVRVGSEVDIEGSSSTGEETPIIGNVSIEYLLTENGRYRLKGFSKNEFENVIDGQTVVSGIALIFTQEFNTYSELWDALFKKQKEEQAKKEADLKAAEERQKKKEASTNNSIEDKKD
ncbi:translocation/assembly module TamB domain-containing protein [Bizionia sp. KMM 8389]